MRRKHPAVPKHLGQAVFRIYPDPKLNLTSRHPVLSQSKGGWILSVTRCAYLLPT